MTMNEYETVIIRHSYELYKAEQERNKVQSEMYNKLIKREQRNEVIQTLKTLDELIHQHQAELTQVLKDLKLARSFTRTREIRELVILTCEIPRDKLLKAFNYYDGRDKTFSLIPKSYYKHIPRSTYIELPQAYKQAHNIPLNELYKYKLKELPQQLRTKGTSSRGYEIETQLLANILNLETSFMYNLRIKEEKRKNSPHRRPEHDYRPYHQKL